MRGPTHRMDLEAIAIDAVRAGATVIRKTFGKPHLVGTKSTDTDVVTRTDLEAEHAIRALLLMRTPGARILGEEGGEKGDRGEPADTPHWIVDPLDGTVNFLYSLPVFAVSVAAAVAGQVVVGAVVDVLRGEVFSATLDGGARCDGKPIGVRAAHDLSQSLVLTGFSYDSALRQRQGTVLQELLPVVRDVRCFGSAALQLCWVGAGRADAYFERDTKLWDWAAGSLVAAEAGALTEQPCPENDALVLAAAPGIAEVLRARI